jgi:hypothetical protein
VAHIQAKDYYETVSRDPATLNQPAVAVKYTIDGLGPFEVRLLKTPGWESKVEAAIRADAQVRQKLLKLDFTI